MPSDPKVCLQKDFRVILELFGLSIAIGLIQIFTHNLSYKDVLTSKTYSIDQSILLSKRAMNVP